VVAITIRRQLTLAIANTTTNVLLMAAVVVTEAPRRVPADGEPCGLNQPEPPGRVSTDGGNSKKGSKHQDRKSQPSGIARPL
jgi:hypothetical protein